VRLTLQAADLPAARLASQGPVHERGYVAAYQRTFSYATPSGSSGFRFVQSEALLAGTAARAASALDRLRATLSSKAGRAAYAAAIARALAVKLAVVRVSPPRTPRVGDHAVELPLSVVVGGRRVYESILYMQLDRVVSVVVSSSVRSTSPVETRAFAAMVAGHIDAALKPRSLAPPSAIGDASVGSVLTGTSGDWSGDATFTFRWQRCDQAGMSCTDVDGATAQTYAVSDADVGFSLRVTVTAANRFGAATVPSGATAVVVAPPPPPPAPAELPWGERTYGGAMASTWLVLRMSCKRRSPVGLLKQPEPNASADHDLALAA
jgi:hypothetical protein